MRHLVIFTGACPQTDGEARLEWADSLEVAGDTEGAEWHRAQNREAHAEWDDQSDVARTRRALSTTVLGPDPNAPVPEMGVMFWHERTALDARRAACPCGHPADLLCDRPIGDAKTCDRPICKCCRVTVAEGLDYCPGCIQIEAALHPSIAMPDASQPTERAYAPLRLVGASE